MKKKWQHFLTGQKYLWHCTNRITSSYAIQLAHCAENITKNIFRKNRRSWCSVVTGKSQ